MAAKFILVSDFVGEINIPGTNRPEVQAQLVPMMEKYETTFLREALGEGLYTAFTNGLAATVPEQRWINLRDGVDYVNGSNVTVHWDGIKQKNFISNFVYYFWTKNNVTQTTPAGEALTNLENATVTTPFRKMVRAWNDIATPYESLVTFLNTNSSLYPEWVQRRAKTFKKLNELGI